MRELLKNKLKVIDTVQDRIIVGYAFMKACYINFSKAGYVYNEAFSTFFTEEVEEILEIKLGREYSLLLRHFV
jgi:flagellar biosynthesis protein FliP